MKHSTKLIVSILFPLGLAFVPASILLPIERAEIENRRLEIPQLAASRLAEPNFYLEVFEYVRDANPARTWLVTAGTGLDFRIFNDTPNPLRAFVGLDGWLFARWEIENMCDDRVDTSVENLHALVDAIEARGTQVIYTIVPSKFELFPEYLRSSQRDLAKCGLETATRLYNLLSEQARDGYVDSWDLFSRLKERAIQSHFLTDTHFHFEGSIPWIRALVSAIDPTIWDPEAVTDEGMVSFAGNLGAFVHPGLTEEVRKVIIDRGLPHTPAEQLHRRISPDKTSTERYLAQSDGLPLIDGQAVALMDSFGDIPAPSLAQYFVDLTVTDWRDSLSMEHFIRMARVADIVIIEINDEALFTEFADQSIAASFSSTD